MDVGLKSGLLLGRSILTAENGEHKLIAFKNFLDKTESSSVLIGVGENDLFADDTDGVAVFNGNAIDLGIANTRPRASVISFAIASASSSSKFAQESAT